MPDAPLPERPSPADYLAEIGAFGGTLALAWALNWQARDVVWSLWISSLTVGYLVTISQSARMPLEVVRGVLTERGTFSWWQAALGMIAVLAFNLFVLGFFTLHFGFFHYIHGSILEAFFPLEDVAYPNGILELSRFVGILMARYYPMVVASAILERRLLLKPEGLNRIEQPYASVVKMHALIFVFAALVALGATNFVFYAVTLLAYFFPWRSLKRRSGVQPAVAL